MSLLVHSHHIEGRNGSEPQRHIAIRGGGGVFTKTYHNKRKASMHISLPRIAVPSTMVDRCHYIPIFSPGKSHNICSFGPEALFPDTLSIVAKLPL